MSDPDKSYKSWSLCSSCDFQGIFVFSCRAGEDYDDPDSLGVLMDTKCPACDEEDTVLVGMEAYQEMVFMAKAKSS